MRVGAFFVTFAFLLAGCAGDSDTGTGAQDEQDSLPADDLPAFNLSFEVGNITAHTPFFVNLTSDLPVNKTLNATWRYTVTQFLNGTTDATQSDGTANETQALNGTNENETVEAQSMVVLEGEGTGLPATLNLTLPPGNFTLTTTVHLDGFAEAMGILAFMVPDVTDETDETVEDPCAGAATQEALTFSGTATGGLLGMPAGPSHTFEVLPCQTKMTVELSYLETGGDMDVDVFDPTGAEAGSGVSGDIGSEGPIVINGPLMPGEWTVQIVYFSSGPATYDLTVTFG